MGGRVYESMLEPSGERRGILEVALFDYINEYFTDCIEQKEKYNPEILMWFIGFCLDEFRGN